MRRWPAPRCCVNLSASNITVGKSAYRHALAASQSARCLAAYAYSSAGQGESTTDLAWDGQALICENGQLLAESERFAADSHCDQRRHRPGAAGARAHAPDQLRPVGGAPCRRAWRASAACPSRWICSASVALQRGVERYPLRAGRPRAARRALPRGLQHPGAGPDAAAVGQRHQEAGDRRVRRAGFDPCAAGVRARRWTRWACRAPTSSA